MTFYELRSRYVALHKDVYVPQGVELTAQLRAKALWLRSRRRGVLAGYSASAFHGAKWIDADLPAAIIDTNRRRAPGLQVWEERIEPDEICVIEGMRVTTPERTALDLTSRFPLDPAVAAVDALIQATDLKVADVEPLIERYRGRRGMKAARAALTSSTAVPSPQGNLAALVVDPRRLSAPPDADRGAQRMGLGGSPFGYGLARHQGRGRV